jgi:hypothetical protein
MADPPPQSTIPRNPNWGGRREGSGRKKQPVLTALPRTVTPVDSVITRTYYLLLTVTLIVFLIFVNVDRYNANTMTDTTQTQVTQHLPVNTTTPTRGFFAPRNCLSTTLHPSPSPTTSISEGTDQEAATNQANGA